MEDYREQVRLYQPLAEQGDIYAQVKLASCYFELQDYTTAAIWYQKAAEEGYGEAQRLLGFMYSKGLGVQLSYMKAIKWYTYSLSDEDEFGCDIITMTDIYDCCYTLRVLGMEQIINKSNIDEEINTYYKDAELGFADAQVKLGNCYTSGYGVEHNNVEAAQWYHKAAEQGNAIAQFNLANCYDFGRGVERDGSEAVKWYTKAAKLGLDAAQFELARCYHNGEGIDQSYNEAIKWYRRAAEQGYAKAEHNIGYCYTVGQGVGIDYKEAVKWFSKAAEKKLAISQCALGACYESGRGVEVDYKKAQQWYSRAVELDWINAEYALHNKGIGYSYYDSNNCINCHFDINRNVRFDYTEPIGKYYNRVKNEEILVREFNWFCKMAEQGDANIHFNLANYFYLGAERGYFLDAIKWYRKAAEQQHPIAQYQLGICYNESYIKDYAEAVKWFGNSAKQGYAPAQFQLGKCYENGFGVEQDYREAMRWYYKAAENGHQGAIEILKK